jgi:hypothetical protein
VELTKEEKKEHMKELTGVCCSSDAFFPFPDNVHRAYRSGATYLCAPGGSIMDEECIKAADEKDIVFVHHNMRLVSRPSSLRAFEPSSGARSEKCEESSFRAERKIVSERREKG